MMKRPTQRGLSAGRRSGFTLTEVVLSTAITGLIMSQITTVLISSQRLMESTLSDVELSIQTHELREKLFYTINDDGGLMDACESEIDFSSNGGGDSVTFKPRKGAKNKVKLNNKKRLTANSQKKDKWLECGTMTFQGTNIFSYLATNGMVKVNVDVAISVGTRLYRQRHLMQTQIMNEE